MADVTPLAVKLFDAYNEQGPNPWKTFDGRDVPRWPDLSDQVRAKWTAAAEAAIAEPKTCEVCGHAVPLPKVEKSGPFGIEVPSVIIPDPPTPTGNATPPTNDGTVDGLTPPPLVVPQ